MTTRPGTVGRSSLLCILLLLAPSAAIPQSLFRPPVERDGFARLTSYDSLAGFLKSLTGQGSITVRQIATTRQGRAVFCVSVSASPHFGTDPTRLRVMLFAQQHGDEPAGKEALTLLLAKIANHTLDRPISTIDLLIVPQMNPDGAELRQRRTADSIDLNRNHVLLTSPETRGLHDLFAMWQPHVTLDIHEYSPESKSWRDGGFVKGADVQLGMLTNLNSSARIRAYERQEVFPSMALAMQAGGYSFHEYLVGSPDEFLRFSTTEPNDGRQSFGILNTLSFIQEGRGGRDPEDHLERRARSQLASIEALLTFCADHSIEIRTLVNREREALSLGQGLPVVLRMDHVAGRRDLRIPVKLVPSGKDSVWSVRPLRDEVKPLCTRMVPSAYVVPRELSAIKELLDRHHVRHEVVRAPRSVTASQYIIEKVQPDTLESESHPKPTLRSERVQTDLREGDIVVPTAQVHSIFVALLFEPESMWGIVKYPGYGHLLESREFPIRRIP